MQLTKDTLQNNACQWRQFTKHACRWRRFTKQCSSLKMGYKTVPVSEDCNCFKTCLSLKTVYKTMLLIEDSLQNMLVIEDGLQNNACRWRWFTKHAHHWRQFAKQCLLLLEQQRRTTFENSSCYIEWQSPECWCMGFKCTKLMKHIVNSDLLKCS